MLRERVRYVRMDWILVRVPLFLQLDALSLTSFFCFSSPAKKLLRCVHDLIVPLESWALHTFRGVSIIFRHPCASSP